MRSSSSELVCWGYIPGCNDAQRYRGSRARFLACAAIVAASINLVPLTGVSGGPTASDGLGFLGVVGTLGASVLLGIATLCAKALPRWTRPALTFLPLAFIPAIIFTIPLESVVSEYVIADLPFPVVGLVSATVGYAVFGGREDAEETKNRTLARRYAEKSRPI